MIANQDGDRHPFRDWVFTDGQSLSPDDLFAITRECVLTRQDEKVYALVMAGQISKKLSLLQINELCFLSGAMFSSSGDNDEKRQKDFNIYDFLHESRDVIQARDQKQREVEIGAGGGASA